MNEQLNEIFTISKEYKNLPKEKKIDVLRLLKIWAENELNDLNKKK